MKHQLRSNIFTGTLVFGIGAVVACSTPAIAHGDPAPGGQPPNVSVSAGGKTIVHLGSSSATSEGRGSLAIAIGPGSVATAGAGLWGRSSNHAVAIGKDNSATARYGRGNTAIAIGDGSSALAEHGKNNTAMVVGDHSRAIAGGSNSNRAVTRGNQSTSDASCSFDWCAGRSMAAVNGDQSSAQATVGGHASVRGSNSSAFADATGRSRVIGDHLSETAGGTCTAAVAADGSDWSCIRNP